MKIHTFINLSVLLAALAITSNTRATLILSDNFTGNTPGNSSDINFNLPGRQSGTLGGNATWSKFGNVQVGNNATNVGQPGGASNGNYMLLAFGASGMLSNVSLSSLNVDAPLLISFDMYNGSSPNSEWTSFTLTQTNNQAAFGWQSVGWPIVENTNDFGFLKRGDGSGGDLFYGGGSDSYSTSGDSFSLLLTDTAGTGSAFSGNGTTIKFMNGATTIGTYSLAAGMGTTYLAFGASGGQIGGVSNLNIQTVPEPATYALLALSLTTVVVLRRRRAA